MSDITIGQIRSRTDITGEGKFREYYEIPFFMDDARHSVRMWADEYTPEKAEALVKEKAAELNKIQGKTLKV